MKKKEKPITSGLRVASIKENKPRIEERGTNSLRTKTCFH